MIEAQKAADDIADWVWFLVMCSMHPIAVGLAVIIGYSTVIVWCCQIFAWMIHKVFA